MEFVSEFCALSAEAKGVSAFYIASLAAMAWPYFR